MYRNMKIIENELSGQLQNLAAKNHTQMFPAMPMKEIVSKNLYIINGQITTQNTIKTTTTITFPDRPKFSILRLWTGHKRFRHQRLSTANSEDCLFGISPEKTENVLQAGFLL